MGLAQLAWLPGRVRPRGGERGRGPRQGPGPGLPAPQGPGERHPPQGRPGPGGAWAQDPGRHGPRPWTAPPSRSACSRPPPWPRGAARGPEDLWQRLQAPPKPVLHGPGRSPGPRAWSRSRTVPGRPAPGPRGALSPRLAGLAARAWSRTSAPRPSSPSGGRAPGPRILDACAAPGGKATALARRFPEAGSPRWRATPPGPTARENLRTRRRRGRDRGGRRRPLAARDGPRLRPDHAGRALQRLGHPAEAPGAELDRRRHRPAPRLGRPAGPPGGRPAPAGPGRPPHLRRLLLAVRGGPGPPGAGCWDPARLPPRAPSGPPAWAWRRAPPASSAPTPWPGPERASRPSPSRPTRIDRVPDSRQGRSYGSLRDPTEREKTPGGEGMCSTFAEGGTRT